MRFSLGRRGSTTYTRGYLRSGAWFTRRRRWFDAVAGAGQIAVCQVCGQSTSLDLHHVSYDGVTEHADGSWAAEEAHEDLMPLCRVHHEQLHAEFDRRRLDFWGWDRRRATAVVIAAMRQRGSSRTREKRGTRR